MFNKIIEQWGGRLYALSLKLCKNNQEDAQDLYQETWLKLYRSHHKYDSSQNYMAWATRICVNSYRDMLRRKNKFHFIYVDKEEDQQAFIEAIPAANRDESYTDLHYAIEKLPEKFRIATILYYFNDCSIDETAKTLGIPAGTVKSRLSKARNLLKKELEQDGK